jgi:hypothetical protein
VKYDCSYKTVLCLSLLPSVAYAEEFVCPPTYAVCLTEEQLIKVTEAVKELDEIKSSEAELSFLEPIVIIRDNEGRVYTSGGSKKPVKLKLKIGKVIDRDLEAELPVKISYRDEPVEDESLFRFRVRAQIGLLAPEVIQSIRDNEFQAFWNVSAGLDFFYIGAFNIAAVIGSDGVGGGVGVDITKNFGTYVAPIVKYEDWSGSLDLGVYMAFN